MPCTGIELAEPMNYFRWSLAKKHPKCFHEISTVAKGGTFVSRRMVKTRDAFDMRLLLAEGAVLDETLKTRLNDLVMWRELDADQTKQITPKLCRAELKPVLPEEVYNSLELLCRTRSNYRSVETVGKIKSISSARH